MKDSVYITIPILQIFCFFFEGWQGIQLNHLWTLAIEEQFYLFWPFIILFTPIKRLSYIIIALIISSIIFKTLGIPSSRMLTISHFDTLGLGALLALLMQSQNKIAVRCMSIIKTINKNVILIILFSLIIIDYKMNFLIVDLLSVMLILGCIYGYTGMLGKLMDSKILVYLGQISYGLYIYHKPIPYFLKLATNATGMNQLNSYLSLIICLVVTVVISHLSFIIIEKRMIKLKKKFDI